MVKIDYMLWDMENQCIVDKEYTIYVSEDTTIERALALMAEDGYLPIKISNLYMLRREGNEKIF